MWSAGLDRGIPKEVHTEAQNKDTSNVFGYDVLSCPESPQLKADKFGASFPSSEIHCPRNSWCIYE